MSGQGISIRVAFNVIFADWMVSVLLIILFLGMSTKAFFKGVETWKKETIIKKRLLDDWRVLNKTTTCSAAYWVLNLLQIPVAFGASAYEAIDLYKGRRIIASRGEAGRIWCVHQLVLYCSGGIVAGVVVGMLGLGGGFILGPLFLELG